MSVISKYTSKNAFKIFLKSLSYFFLIKIVGVTLVHKIQ